MDLQYMLSISSLILQGVEVTLKIYVVTLLFSIPLGIICALGKLSKSKILKAILGFYTWIFRGTPLLLQLCFTYYGVSILTNGAIQFTPMHAAYATFIINYGAYFTEIFRAGIQSIDKGQYEAAKALGISPKLTMKRIILPQAIKVILPPVGNEAITLIKDTALASVIAVTEILRLTNATVTRDVRLEGFLVAALIYLALSAVVIQVFRLLEKKYTYYKD